VIVPIEQREENVVIGPAPARSHKRWGVRHSARGSPPARQRRAAGEVDDSDESLLSEETLAKAAWPRAKTADGGRALRRDDQSAFSTSVAGGTGS
jgi:hypothetical protein